MSMIDLLLLGFAYWSKLSSALRFVDARIVLMVAHEEQE